MGEFSALVVAGAIDYLDAIELVHKEGLFMTEACLRWKCWYDGFVGIDDATVEKMCAEQRELGKKYGQQITIWMVNLFLAGIKADLESLVDVISKMQVLKTSYCF